MTGSYFGGATTRSQQLTQSYANMIGLSEFAGESSGYMDGDVMMNSVFGNNAFSSLGGYYGGYTQKEQEMYNNMTSAEIAAYQMVEQENLQKLQNESKLRTEFYDSSKDLAITEHATRAKELVEENKQDEASAEFGLLKTAIREKYAKAGIALTDKQVITYTQQEYSTVNGTSIVNDLKTNGDSEFVHGLKQGVLTPLVGGIFTQKKTPKDTLKEITGEEKSKGDKLLGVLGATLSTVATCVAAPLAVLLIAKGGVGAASLVGKGYSKLWGSLFKNGAKVAENVAKAAI